MRALRTLVVIAALALPLGASATASAATPAPHLSWVKCTKLCGAGKTQVQKSGEIKLAGRRFSSGARVAFFVKSGGKRTSKTVKATLTGTTRLVAKVPSNALSGRVYVRLPGGRRTNSKGPLTMLNPPKIGPPASPATGTAFDGDGMWIWMIGKSDGGDPNAIAARAKAAGIETLFIKSGDGGTYWEQFSPELVNALHAAGIKACGWQFVYGSDPSAEAAAAVRAVHSGADCFVIDAESQYEHNAKKYENAATYLTALRSDPQVGQSYPVGLSGFPYVDSHPGFPYSTFLGPGGAQFNLPQVYWSAIGDTVDESVTHTYLYNRPYGRPIVPLGQTYGNPGPPAADLTRFRQLTAAGGSKGLSWWSYQETDDNEWAALGTSPGALTGPPPAADFVELTRGAKGDLVVWAQRLLAGSGQTVGIDGDFGPGTQTAVTSFQASHGLAATGTVNTETWKRLLESPPAKLRRAPKSAQLKAKRYEIAPKEGAGVAR